ncbi:hypothetical protein HOY82DRAFT_630338, partial [Tuber indicum]
MTKFVIDILSDDPVRHHETFILKPEARVKFTSIFKLNHQSAPNTLPQHLDIPPELKLVDGRWWGFGTESSSFIFRRNLETILSHAMPLPKPHWETYQPYVPHNHDLINMHPTWRSFMNQAFYLLEIDKALQQQNTADDETKSHYRERIQNVIFGCFTFLLGDAERNGPGNVSPYQPADLALPVKPDEAGEVVGGEGTEEERDGLTGTAESSSKDKVVDTARPVGAPGGEIDSADPQRDSSFLLETPGSTSSLNKTSALHPGKTEDSIDSPPMRPIEPELFKYEASFEDCYRLLILLDKCLTNYPDEKGLITRMVECFLKLVWQPIEMSKHEGSQLWPDRLERLGGLTPPYARFRMAPDNRNCGYGGQGIYVYDIMIQVVIWRAVRATNRLLDLVSGDRDWSQWMVHQSLDDKAIRNRTIEAFLHPGTNAGQRSSPDRFISKIRGHVREPFLEKRACTIAIQSLVDDFFFDDNSKPISAWTETLKYCDTLSDSSKAQTPDTWESFMRYQLATNTDREELRERLEARAFSVGLFASDLVTPSSHGLCTPYWDIVTHFLSSHYAHPRIPKIDAPTGTNGARGPMLPQEGLTNAGANLGTSIIVGVRQDERKSGKKGESLYMTAEDLRQVNDPPSYGKRYWFRDPLFMKYEPKKFEINRKSIEDFLEPGYSFVRGDIEGNWCCFWKTDEGPNKFLESIADMSNYGWGDNKNILMQPYRKIESAFFRGGEALLKLQGQRDRRDKKRIIVMGDCAIEHLISLMANLDYQEAGHINQFLLRLTLMDSHEMRFEEQTIMPDNLWITEFNINFLTTPSWQDVESSNLPNYFPRRRARFPRMNDTPPNCIMVEASMGFRFIGDLHDRCWTCYVFYNFGKQEIITDTWTGVERIDSYKTQSQRKCLEGFLVRQALDLVLSQTKTVLSTITTSTGEDNESQELFSALLTEDDLRGENYFKTMSKNRAFYPWVLDVYGALRDKCKETRSVAMLWMSAEEKRKYKPRWSEKDQRDFGEEIVEKRADVKARCAKLEKMTKNLQERIERIKTLKESLSSELALREARTSTQLTRAVNLFAVVTAIYLPLTFSTSIVAIQDFHWPSPAKALIRIILAVASGTLILIMNLASLRRNLGALKRRAQRSIRKRMAGAPKPKSFGEEPICQENQPAWKYYWKKRARRLHEAEKRSAYLTDNGIHNTESDWWYWYFLAIYITIVVPVQELTFIIRTLRLQKIENAGPLKKLVRLSGFPIWALYLVFVYSIMLAGYAFLPLASLVHRTVVWLWTGNDTPESKKAALEEVEKSSTWEPEGDAEVWESEPYSTQENNQQDRGLVDWLMKPAKVMMLLTVREALQPKKKRIPDV